MDRSSNMSAKAPSAILKKEAPKSQDRPEPSDRRVSWGNYRVREYLSIQGEESPIGPLIEAEDLMSAPLSSNSHSSTSDQPYITPPRRVSLHMNIETTPDEAIVSFSGRWTPMPDYWKDDCPEQCSVKPALPLTPRFVGCRSIAERRGIVRVATPIRGRSRTPSASNTPSQDAPPCLPLNLQTPPSTSLHIPFSSHSSHRESLQSHFSEPNSALPSFNMRQLLINEDDEMQKIIDGLREVEKSAQRSISTIREMKKECEKQTTNMHFERDRLRQQLAASTEELQCRMQENDLIASQRLVERMSLVNELFYLIEPWQLLCRLRGEEGEVENYGYRTGFYGKQMRGGVRLKVVLGEVTFGELAVEERVFPSPALQVLAQDLLPPYLSHFQSKTHNQSRATILDLAAHSIDRLLVCFLGFEKLHRDFNVISAKMNNQKLVTKFSFATSRVLMATTSPLTLETRLENTKGEDVYTLATAFFAPPAEGL